MLGLVYARFEGVLRVERGSGRRGRSDGDDEEELLSPSLPQPSSNRTVSPSTTVPSPRPHSSLP